MKLMEFAPLLIITEHRFADGLKGYAVIVGNRIVCYTHDIDEALRIAGRVIGSKQ
jgi:ABC-type proline/glycine betaine transport system ATPase subunit